MEDKIKELESKKDVKGLEQVIEEANVSFEGNVAGLAQQAIDRLNVKTESIKTVSPAQVLQVESIGGSTDEIKKRTEGVDQEIDAVKAETEKKVEEIEAKVPTDIAQETQLNPEIETDLNELLLKISGVSGKGSTGLNPKKGLDRSFELLDNITPLLNDLKIRKKVLESAIRLTNNLDKINLENVDGSENYQTSAKLRILRVGLKNLADKIREAEYRAKDEDTKKKYDYDKEPSEADILYQRAGNVMLAELQNRKDYEPGSPHNFENFIESSGTLENLKRIGDTKTIQDILKEIDRIIDANVYKQNQWLTGMKQKAMSKESSSWFKKLIKLREELGEN